MGEIIGELRFGQIMKLIILIRSDDLNGAGIVFYRLRLEPFEIKVFKICLMVLLEI